jgi:hypothetical protein
MAHCIVQQPQPIQNFIDTNNRAIVELAQFRRVLDNTGTGSPVREDGTLFELGNALSVMTSSGWVNRFLAVPPVSP